MTTYQFLFGIPMLCILGLLFGSYINMVVYRLPKKMERQFREDAYEYLELENKEINNEIAAIDRGDMAGRSSCPHCKKTIKWYLLTPLLGWFFTLGKCSNCKVSISPRYPIVEFFVSVIFGIVAWKVGPHPVVLAWAALAGALITLALIDADTMLLPDIIVLPLMWIGLLLSTFGYINVKLPDAVIGAVSGYMFLWIVTEIFRIVTGKIGMGNGDMKLLAVGGAWMGWLVLPNILITASVLGVIYGVYQRIKGNLEKGGAMPFGPFLALGILVVAFTSYIPKYS